MHGHATTVFAQIALHRPAVEYRMAESHQSWASAFRTSHLSTNQQFLVTLKGEQHLATPPVRSTLVLTVIVVLLEAVALATEAT